MSAGEAGDGLQMPLQRGRSDEGGDGDGDGDGDGYLFSIIDVWLPEQSIESEGDHGPFIP